MSQKDTEQTSRAQSVIAVFLSCPKQRDTVNLRKTSNVAKTPYSLYLRSDLCNLNQTPHQTLSERESWAGVALLWRHAETAGRIMGKRVQQGIH